MLSTGNLLEIWGLYSPWNSPVQNTGVLRSRSLLQEIFPSHGSNPGLPQRTRVLYQLNHQGSPNARTVAHQAPPSMGFSRQEYWSGLPFPSPEDLPSPGIEPGSLALQADALPSEAPGKPNTRRDGIKNKSMVKLTAMAMWQDCQSTPPKANLKLDKPSKRNISGLWEWTKGASPNIRSI